MSFLLFLLRRLLALIPLLLIMSIITYILIIQGGGGLVRLFSMDQIQIEKALLEVELGLDRSPVINYFRWLREVLQGNIGVIDDRVGGETGLYAYVLERLGKSLFLLISGISISLFIGLPLGVWAALNPKSLLTRLIDLFISFGITIPNFIFGFFLIYLFAVRLGIFPVGGFEGIEAGLGDIQGLWLLLDRLRHLILPSLTLGLPAASIFTNQVKQGMQEVVKKEYVRTAHAKGLSSRRVLLKHILPNGLSTLMASFFALLPHFIGSLVIVEVIFSWPGLAYFAFRQGLVGDYYVILIVLIFTALLVLSGGIFTEIIHALLDPRIREQESLPSSFKVQKGRRLAGFFGLALIFSLLYYPLQELLIVIPTPSIHLLSGLLLIFYSLFMVGKARKYKRGERASFALFAYTIKKTLSNTRDLFHSLVRGRDPSLMIGLLLLLIILLLTSWPWDYSQLYEMDSRTRIRYQRHPPTLQSPLGTDEMAHDVLLKTFYHGRETLALGFKMVAMVILIGGSLGLLAGFIGGALDLILSYMIQILSSFPLYFLMMLAIPFLGTEPGGIIVLLGVIGSLQLFKVVRIRVLSLRKQEFVEGASALGVSQLGIIRKYILPNILPLLLAEGSLLFGQMMVYISALGFLGFIPWGGWGEQMAQGRYYEWWIKLGPSLALMLTVLSLYLLGRGFSKTIDPFHDAKES